MSILNTILIIACIVVFIIIVRKLTAKKTVNNGVCNVCGGRGYVSGFNCPKCNPLDPF